MTRHDVGGGGPVKLNKDEVKKGKDGRVHERSREFKSQDNNLGLLGEGLMQRSEEM